MRIADLDFILVPEWLARDGGRQPDSDHWISRWQRNIKSASWLKTHNVSAREALLDQCVANRRPTIIITHGHGVDVLLDIGPDLADTPAAGAFIVAPAPRSGDLDAAAAGALPLPVPSVIVAPDDHPDISTDVAQSLSDALGGHFVAAGLAGRLDSSTGQGPWPEGLMRLGWFLKRLSAH
ncbi:MAG: alpha/beta hydrolase [Hyphomicrobiaceae bacterium]